MLTGIKLREAMCQLPGMKVVKSDICDAYHHCLAFVLNDVARTTDFIPASQAKEHQLVGWIDRLIGTGRIHRRSLSLARHDCDPSTKMLDSSRFKCLALPHYIQQHGEWHARQSIGVRLFPKRHHRSERRKLAANYRRMYISEQGKAVREGDGFRVMPKPHKRFKSGSQNTGKSRHSYSVVEPRLIWVHLHS